MNHSITFFKKQINTIQVSFATRKYAEMSVRGWNIVINCLHVGRVHAATTDN